jgi:hypothetical protein
MSLHLLPEEQGQGFQLLNVLSWEGALPGAFHNLAYRHSR